MDVLVARPFELDGDSGSTKCRIRLDGGKEDVSCPIALARVGVRCISSGSTPSSSCLVFFSFNSELAFVSSSFVSDLVRFPVTGCGFTGSADANGAVELTGMSTPTAFPGVSWAALALSLPSFNELLARGAAELLLLVEETPSLTLVVTPRSARGPEGTPAIFPAAEVLDTPIRALGPVGITPPALALAAAARMLRGADGIMTFVLSTVFPVFRCSLTLSVED